MPQPALSPTVEFLVDIPKKVLRRGQVGTVVEALSTGVYEVEFSDNSGQDARFSCRPRSESFNAPSWTSTVSRLGKRECEMPTIRDYLW